MDLQGPDFSDSRNPIFSDYRNPMISFSDSRDLLFNSRDPNRDPKTHKKTCYNQSRLWSRLQTTLAQITRMGLQKKLNCIENLFTVHDFLTTFACPEKPELP